MPLHHHFLRPGHSFEDVRVSILERVEEHLDIIKREVTWMNQLDTMG
jgi:hypothetical protein